MREGQEQQARNWGEGQKKSQESPTDPYPGTSLKEVIDLGPQTCHAHQGIIADKGDHRPGTVMREGTNPDPEEKTANREDYRPPKYRPDTNPGAKDHKQGKTGAPTAEAHLTARAEQQQTVMVWKMGR